MCRSIYHQPASGRGWYFVCFRGISLVFSGRKRRQNQAACTTSLQTLQRAFSTPLARAPQAPNLTFERLSEVKVSSLSLAGSSGAPGHPCGKQLPEPVLGTARLGSGTRRGDTSGRRRGGGGAGERGRAGREEGREEGAGGGAAGSGGMDLSAYA